MTVHYDTKQTCHGTMVEDVVAHQAWCPKHGVVGPLRHDEQDATDDADDHYIEYHGTPDGQ